jgi:pyruvate formate lyase activating enzyme
MSSDRLIAVRNEQCLDCGFCREFIACPVHVSGCIGCGACVKSCPENAIHLEARAESAPLIHFTVDGKDSVVAGRLSVLQALVELGLLPNENGGIRGHCGTGGCWNCEVLVDNSLALACMTPLKEGMAIRLDPEAVGRKEPRRILTLMRPPPHFHPSIFTHGCNYACDLCHNWNLTFASTGLTLTPEEAVKRLCLDPERDTWVGISGGEPTLNRRWLVAAVRGIRRTVADIRIQLDTNASILTPDYISELVAAGVTDVSPDLKALHLETFMNVTGVRSKPAARVYLETSWESVRILDKTYRGRVMTAVSVPCHPRTHSLNELDAMARAIASINPDLPVTLIEYQPAFRRRTWPIAGKKAMEQVKELFESAGVKRVVVQGGAEVPQALDPLDLALSSEEF